MILYQLHCGQDHEFEAWFRNSDAYDKQEAKGLVTCPVCGDTKVGKAVMAPRLGKGASVQPPAEEQMRMVMTKVAELNKHIEDTCDYVGDNFAEEARKIHYGETKRSREIYGEATPDEAEKLHEEGIKVAPVPWIKRSDS